MRQERRSTRILQFDRKRLHAARENLAFRILDKRVGHPVEAAVFCDQCIEFQNAFARNKSGAGISKVSCDRLGAEISTFQRRAGASK